MRIGINASFTRKPYTGIAQVSRGFLETLIKKESLFPTKETEFFIYSEEPINLSWPTNFHPVILKSFWKRDDLARKVWWEKYALPRQIKKDKCQFFFSLYQCPTILPKNIKHIMLVHDIIPKLFPQYLNNFRKKLYWQWTEWGIKKSDKILAISHYTEKDLIKHLNLNPKKIGVVYPDCGEEFSQKASDRQIQKVLGRYGLKKPFILAGGGLEQRKNIENLLMAYKILLSESGSPIKFPSLAIVGKLMPQLAPLVTDAEKIVSRYNLTQSVKLLGFVPQSDLPSLYQSALGFVYPSFYEGFGLPVLEAMRSGTPVVTSKLTSLPEVGGDGVLYCDAYDAKDVAMVIRNLVQNEKLRHQVVERGYQRAQKFSMENLVEKFLNLAHGKD